MTPARSDDLGLQERPPDLPPHPHPPLWQRRTEDVSSPPTRLRAAQYQGKRTKECEKAACRPYSGTQHASVKVLVHTSEMSRERVEIIQRMLLNKLLTMRCRANAMTCHIMRPLATVCIQAEGTRVLAKRLLSGHLPFAFGSQ